MTTAQRHRDTAYRHQPGLFDLPAEPERTGTDAHFSPAPAVAPAQPVDLVDQGPASRNETYAAVQGDHDIARSKWYARIVAAGRYGVTLDELSHRYNVPPNAISGRITELAKHRLVIRTAQRRETRASTPDRRITAAVIVATRFLTDPVTAKPQTDAMTPAADVMPDQDTLRRTPTDQDGNTIQPGRLYSVGTRGRSPRVVKVFESDCETFCQESRIDGSPVAGSRPQRIDAMDNDASWILIFQPHD